MKPKAHLTYDELHRLCRKRGHATKDWMAAPETRPSTMDATVDYRARKVAGDMDTSEELTEDWGECSWVHDLHVASVVATAVARGRVLW